MGKNKIYTPVNGNGWNVEGSVGDKPPDNEFLQFPVCYVRYSKAIIYTVNSFADEKQVVSPFSFSSPELFDVAVK